jgi:Spy/CpxP family protein refolding chaperone
MLGIKHQHRNSMKTRRFVKQLAVFTSLLVAAAFQVAAQPGPGGGMGGMGGILTEEQRTKLRESMQSSQTELTQLNEKLAAAQKEAITAALADKADEKAVRSKIEAVTKIQTDIAMLRFKGLKEIKSTFTDEQKTQIGNRPGVAYMMLFGTFGGGGPRRAGGAGGGGGNN